MIDARTHLFLENAYHPNRDSEMKREKKKIECLDPSREIKKKNAGN